MKIDLLPLRNILYNDLRKFHSLYGAVDLFGATRTEYGIVYDDEFNEVVVNALIEVIIPMMRRGQLMSDLTVMDHDYLCRMVCIEPDPSSSREEEAVMALLHLFRVAWEFMAPLRGTLRLPECQREIDRVVDYVLYFSPEEIAYV